MFKKNKKSSYPHQLNLQTLFVLSRKHAYERGAKNVHIRWSDGVLARLKYEHAPQDVFEQFHEWEA
ncbi:aminopeptidase [Bacillus sp. SL00103]